MNIILETIWVTIQVLYECIMPIIRWILPSHYKSVKDEICLITGAGSGIGRLMALEFAKKGSIMILWDVDEKGNKETADMIREIGGEAFTQKCDVSNRKDVYEMARQAKEEVGDVTILVNNAGIVYGKGLLELKDEEMERTMNVNSIAHFWTVRAFLPSMMERNHGHIVTVSSIMGLIAVSGMPAYVASKHAATGFNNALEYDLRALKMDGIKTTLVCPYHITTGMFSGISVRFPALLPSLTPDECVAAIMHAVLTNRHMVAIPRSMYLFNNMVSWAPENVLIILNKFLGTSKSMKSFLPARSYQKEAVKQS